MRTRWADHVDRALPLPDHPRPQLVRPDRWVNLNGSWDAALHAAGDRPQFNEQILVPFPIGSVLSGLDHVLQPSEVLTVQRSFAAPDLGAGHRLRLHFGAVDQVCEVAVNGVVVGDHTGGFDPFFFDVTNALVRSGDQLVRVAITDPTDHGDRPLGKQTLTPFAIQYTAVAGIWQTVWLEVVPDACIETVVATTDLAASEVRLAFRTSGVADGTEIAASVRAPSGAVDGETVATCLGVVTGNQAELTAAIGELRPWSPADPYLYDVGVSLGPADARLDDVGSYFGAREVGRSEGADGMWRLTLNGQPIFHLGLLDQGWWPDGLYTAPTDEALVSDIEATLAMGFNTIRKHVKVEPARWYWHCDRLGILVWQDMPSTRFDMLGFGAQLGDQVEPPDMPWHEISPGRDPEGFQAELDAMLDALEPFCSIVVWVPFNEAWGQAPEAAMAGVAARTDVTLAHVAARDPSRLVDGPSGWVDTGTGDIRDYHEYRFPEAFPGPDAQRPVVYGEYGGFKLAIDGHTWTDEGWGYSTTKTAAELEAAYLELTNVIADLIPKGLAGAIYTQTTDVESEINGLLTYDREFKIPPEQLSHIHDAIWRRALGSGAPRAPR